MKTPVTPILFVFLTGPVMSAPVQEAYVKASNAAILYEFGASVDVDGDTAVVGSPKESGGSSGVNGDQSNLSLSGSGAAYVFIRRDGVWTQQAYLKSLFPKTDKHFGASVAIRGDNLAVGSDGEVYFFVREGDSWTVQDSVASPNGSTTFGNAVDIDGDTAVIGDRSDSSNSTGINGDEFGHGATGSGAAYVYVRHDGFWDREAYLKSAHPDGKETNTGGVGDNFGVAVSLSGDTVVVGANKESGDSAGVNGDETSNLRAGAGAAYVFTRTGGVWNQQAYLKASNPDIGDNFGQSVAIDGDNIIAGAPLEGGAARGVNGNQADNTAAGAGAAYFFHRTSGSWSQQAYLKASNTDVGDGFGHAVAIDGDLAAVSAWYEGSAATGVNGDQSDNTKPHTGAVYVFGHGSAGWVQTAYVKASNPRVYTQFGGNFIGLSGELLVVGSQKEWSKAKGINDLANQFDESQTYSGAAYFFSGFSVTASDPAVTITAAALTDSRYIIDFTAAPGRTGWRVMGSSNLVSFPDDRTAGSTIVESPAGHYRATVDLSGAPATGYFLRIEN